MGKAKRERAREKRDMEAERERAAAAVRTRTQRRLLFIGIPILAALIVAAVLIGTSSSSGSSTGGDGTSKAGLKPIANVEQHGLTLGDPEAPVTIREFADLQCPVCRRFSEEVLPELLDDVKAGKVKIVYEPYAILGPDSEVAADALLANVQENKAWRFIETFYANQGRENSGYVTDEFIDRVAQTAGMNVARMRTKIEGQSQVFADKRAEVTDAARGYGYKSTPTLRIEGPGGAETIEDPFDLDEIDAAIDSVGPDQVDA